MLIKFIGQSILELGEDNMDFIMPAIAVILALRDRNYDFTMEAIDRLNRD